MPYTEIRDEEQYLRGKFTLSGTINSSSVSSETVQLPREAFPREAALQLSEWRMPGVHEPSQK
ncbi:MAG: hypothetical protein AB7S99_06515 [Pseudodonghicola sp.]